MTKFIKLTKDSDGENVWVNMDKVDLIGENNGGSVIRYPDGSTLSVAEFHEKIMSRIQAAENELNSYKGYQTYSGFALAADLNLLLEEFRDFKRLLSSELEMYNKRLNKLEHRDNQGNTEPDELAKSLMKGFLRKRL